MNWNNIKNKLIIHMHTEYSYENQKYQICRQKFSSVQFIHFIPKYLMQVYLIVVIV